MYNNPLGRSLSKPYYCHERGLFLRPTMTNAISYTDSYINIGHSYTNFSTSQLALFNSNLSIYNTR